MAEGLKPTNGGGSVPVPDPTERTEANLRREIDAVKERMAHDSEAMRNLLFARIDANAVNILHLQEKIDNLPSVTATAMAHLQELHEEKFQGVKMQFELRDVQQTRQDASRETALVNALATAKELVEKQNIANTTAINKSELQFAQQIQQINTLITASTENFSGKVDDMTKNFMGQIDDLKARVGKIEGIAVGVLTQKTDVVQNTGLHQSWIGIGLTSIGIAIVVAVAILKP